MSPTPFSRRTLDELVIDDERSFNHVGLYADLKQILVRDAYPFRIMRAAASAHGDRALLLNLTFWGAADGGDVLVDEHVDADVVAHVAWHHLAARAFPAIEGARPTVDSLFVGEAIASAFDVYLVGRLLGHARGSTFLETQVPLMSETAEIAGATDDEIESMLAGIADDPDGAFTSLYGLLFDATSALYACRSAEAGQAALEALGTHRFSRLLHRFELSNWVLYARAYGDASTDDRARGVDAALRSADVALDWLDAAWVQPALKRSR